MSIYKFRLGRTEKEIIKYIGLGTMLLVALGSPSSKMPGVILKTLKQNGIKHFKKIIKRLQNKNVIYLGGEKIKLTKKGRELFKLINLLNLKIKAPKEWDRKWRLVSYDIPVISSKKRDWFRHTLINLGFEKIQDSLWVFPYECKEEIAVIAQNLGVAAQVVYMTTDYLPNQINIEKRFRLELDQSQKNS